MKAYLDLVTHVLDQGTAVPSVQGVSCLRLTRSPQIDFEFANGHPVITTRSLKGSLRSIFIELFWIISGSCWNNELTQQFVEIWTNWDNPKTRTKPEWQRPLGYLGPIYGHQFRNFGATRRSDGTYDNDGFDQLMEVLRLLKTDPYNRRIYLTTRNPKDAQHSFIVPCWGDFHFLVEDGGLWVKNRQRSCDLLIGGAFDIVSHSLFFELIGRHVGLKVDGFTWSFDDLHIYLNQIAQLTDLSYPTGRLDPESGEEIMEIDQNLLIWANTTGRSIENLYQIPSHLPVDQRQGNRLKDWLEQKPRSLPRFQLHPQMTNMFEFAPEDIILTGYHPHPPVKGIPVLL